MYDKVEISTDRKTVYMACPYSSFRPDDGHYTKEELYEASFEYANRGAAYLMVALGKVVFSPITHSHILDPLTGDSSHSFWLTQDYYWVKMCDELWILQLPGWDSSFGVGWEHGVSTILEKPIYYLDWQTVLNWERTR